jgi:hypothetical protein
MPLPEMPLLDLELESSLDKLTPQTLLDMSDLLTSLLVMDLIKSNRVIKFYLSLVKESLTLMITVKKNLDFSL